MIRLNDISTLPPEGSRRRDYEKKTKGIVQKIGELGRVFEGDGSHALLIVLQGMDASGKDGVKRSVFKQVSPGVVCSYAFKKPTSLELSHDFLWRIHRVVPALGHMMVFNRSHYEDVLIQRVHKWIDKDRVEKRIAAINNFEEMLEWDNNTTILKFYLHISREKQLEKLQDRMENPGKRWKHNPNDLKESEHWDSYMDAFENAINKSIIPWHVIPADKRWYRNFKVAEIVMKTLEDMNLKLPAIKEE